jgi:hypothetical protein
MIGASCGDALPTTVEEEALADIDARLRELQADTRLQLRDHEHRLGMLEVHAFGESFSDEQLA